MFDFNWYLFFPIFAPGPDTVGETDIVEWVNDGDAIIYNMSYNNGRLLVKNAGYYYLYSKLQLDAAEKCSLIQHKVMRETKAYDTPLELMKSKRLVSAPLLTSFLCCCTCAYHATCLALHLCIFTCKLKSVPSSLWSGKCVLWQIWHVSSSFHCLTPRPSNRKNPEEQDLWQSFLAGIFKLDSGDKIFVKLENIKKMRPGPTDNFMGAFMISP